MMLLLISLVEVKLVSNKFTLLYNSPPLFFSTNNQTSFMNPQGAKNKSKMAAAERFLKWLFPFALVLGSTKSLPDVIRIGKTYCFYVFCCSFPGRFTFGTKTFWPLQFWAVDIWAKVTFWPKTFWPSLL